MARSAISFPIAAAALTLPPFVNSPRIEGSKDDAETKTRDPHGVET